MIDRTKLLPITTQHDRKSSWTTPITMVICSKSILLITQFLHFGPKPHSDAFAEHNSSLSPPSRFRVDVFCRQVNNFRLYTWRFVLPESHSSLLSENYFLSPLLDLRSILYWLQKFHSLLSLLQFILKFHDSITDNYWSMTVLCSLQYFASFSTTRQEKSHFVVLRLKQRAAKLLHQFLANSCSSLKFHVGELHFHTLKHQWLQASRSFPWMGCTAFTTWVFRASSPLSTWLTFYSILGSRNIAIKMTTNFHVENS